MSVNTERYTESADQPSEEIAPWIELFARIGYVAKGVVYAIVGILALQVVLGQGGQTTGPTGAFEQILTEPYGQVLLAIVAFGLVGYALWRFVQAIFDSDHKGEDVKGLLYRGGYVVSGVVYIGLAAAAVRLLMGSGGSSGGNAQGLTARLMSQPYGPWLVALVGVALIGGGLAQFYRAYTAEFEKYFKFGEMSATEQKWATRAGRFGFAARGVIYLIIGGFLIQAGLQHNPDRAGGLGKALDTLLEQPYGPWALGIVALGLVGYGIYAAATARYRRIFVW